MGGRGAMLEVRDLAGGYCKVQVKMTMAWTKQGAVGIEMYLNLVVIGGVGLTGLEWE